MSRFGKCQNLSGCLLAYRGEETEVEDNQPFVCAECGKPLAEVKSPAGFWLRYVYAIGGVLVLAIVAVFSVPSLRNMFHGGHGKDPIEKVDVASSQHAAENTDPNNPDTPASETPVPVRPSPDKGGTTSIEPQPAEPPSVITPERQTDKTLVAAEQQAVRKAVKDQVLTRIDSMTITSGNKDKLYAAVEKARVMRKILTIPFNSGRTDLTDIQELKTQLEDPDLKKLRDDPTAVFVILGYADPKGDPAANKRYSQKRADAVRDAMRDKCDVINIMHSLGMGGSKLLDAQNLEKNRIVEIWVVLP